MSQDNTTTSPKPRRRKLGWKLWLAFLLIPYLLFAIALAGVEAYVRFTKPHVPSLQVFVEVVFPGIASDNERNHLFQGEPWLSWTFLPNLENEWWNYTTFSTNDQGLRYPGHVESKPSGRKRILCMGDSVTFGFRVPETSEADPTHFEPDRVPYPAVLERRLNEGLPKMAYDVIPLAVPGYTTHQGRIWLERDIEKYDPDVVTILYGFNDTHMRTIEDKVTVPTTRMMVFQRWVMMRSQAMIYLVRWLEERKRSKTKVGDSAPEPVPVNRPRVSREDYVANILEMARIAKDHGAQVIVMSPVYRDQSSDVEQGLRIMDYARSLGEAAKANEVPFLKMSEVDMTGSPLNNPLFGEPIHPNYIGHHVMAGEILNMMTEKGMLD